MTDDAGEFKAALREFLSNSELSGIRRKTIVSVMRSTVLDMAPPVPSPVAASDYPELSELSNDVMSAVQKAVASGTGAQDALEEVVTLAMDAAFANVGETGARAIAERVISYEGSPA